MSDSAFPFGASSGQHEAVEDRPSRQKLLIVLAAGIVVAALLGYFVALPLLSGGGKSGSAAAPRVLTPQVSPSPAVIKPKPVPKTFNGVLGRDPFHPLVQAPAAATSTTSVSTAASSTSTPTTAPTTAPTTTPGMITFKVLSVRGTSATVTVDAQRYTVSVGHAFAKKFKLLKTAGGSCAQFLYGESKIGLCEGQTLIF